jgi:hypothetical protein
MRKTLTLLGVIALVLALTAGAGAASTIWVTGANVKNNSLTGADIRNGSLTQADLKVRSIGVTRLSTYVQSQLMKAATPGPAGPAGAAGASAYDTVPSGKTIHGVVGFGQTTTAGNEDMEIDQQLSMPAAAALKDSDVYVSLSGMAAPGTGQIAPTTTDTNAGCTGTAQNPTAPAGKVCVYVVDGANAANVQGSGLGANGSPYGFKLSWQSQTASGGRSYVDAVYAYTAP